MSATPMDPGRHAKSLARRDWLRFIAWSLGFVGLLALLRTPVPFCC